MDQSELDDATKGREAYEAFIHLFMHPFDHDEDVILSVVEAGDGQPMVLVEADAETLLLTVQEAMDASAVLTMVARLLDDEPDAPVILELAHDITEIVAEALGMEAAECVLH
ncbi:hypothetical protein [Methylobacterium sp. WL19]|uniref:hypothetical protein n=1 Tax=Methylobacterium sp. WL19 TaxID=2603896 RepID=UPI0011C91F82|nr:hypothetical protein [Methylobacterium sp. WL19]TXN33917.1 hypothetical protein FV220_00265 [Methylobacterium sp. WL19]